MNTTTTSTVFVKDTDFSNVGTGINLNSSAGNLAILQANHVTIEGNVSGVVLSSNAFAFVTESFLGRNTGGSAMQAGNGCTLDVSHTKLYSNTTAINALAGSTVRVNENEIFDNSNGFAGTAASFQSGANNKLVGNASSIAPTGPALTTQ
jgi:hypothetical protein